MMNSDLPAQVFIPSRIWCKPMMNPALMRANVTKAHVPSASSSFDFLNADRGDLLICTCWKGSIDTIIYVPVKNLSSKTYRNLPPKKVLERHEK
mmetsp:Transcript_21618/g.27895  ORF Transcript_21618/g.27895 Transcript_21618/m.27895 type:complete len:94 (+) Transcript_21618:41-322(+)